MVDCGAERTVVRRDALGDELARMMRPCAGRSLVGASNGSIAPVGEIALSVRYRDRVVDLKNVAVVGDCPVDILLGNDWLLAVGGRVDADPGVGKLVFSLPHELHGETGGNKADGTGGDETIPVVSGVNEGESTSPPEIMCCAVEGVKRGHLHAIGERRNTRLRQECVLEAGVSRWVDLAISDGDGAEYFIEGKVGEEWAVPHCLGRVYGGSLGVLVSNTSDGPLRISGRDLHVRVWRASGEENCGGNQGEVMAVAVEGGTEREDLVINMGDNLTVEQRGALDRVVRMHSGCFGVGSLPESKPVHAAFEHRIETGSARPVHVPPRRMSLAERLEIQREVDEMLKAGVVEPSRSPWASPIVLVKKKDGTARFCVDYRALNAVTKKDVYPLPRLDDVLDRLGGSRYFSSLDLYRGFWQLPVAGEDREKTAFITPDGLFQFRRMPFGLSGSPASFMRMMDAVLAGLKWHVCLVYMDDVLVFSATFEQHLDRLGSVLRAIGDAGLILQPKKCLFAADSTTYLGHRVSADGIGPDPERVMAIAGFPVPSSLRQLRRFLGMASFYRRFIGGFARLSAPLTALLKKGAMGTGGFAASWSAGAQAAFEALRSQLGSVPVLSHLEDGSDLVLHTDASKDGLGAVLSQIVQGRERPVCFLSRGLTGGESGWHSNRLECLAVVWAVGKLRPYLYGRTVVVRTDNCVAATFGRRRDLTGVEARWVEKLADFDLEFRAVRGTSNAVADALSRAPVGSSGRAGEPGEDDNGWTAGSGGEAASAPAEKRCPPSSLSCGGEAGPLESTGSGFEPSPEFADGIGWTAELEGEATSGSAEKRCPPSLLSRSEEAGPPQQSFAGFEPSPGSGGGESSLRKPGRGEEITTGAEVAAGGASCGTVPSGPGVVCALVRPSSFGFPVSLEELAIGQGRDPGFVGIIGAVGGRDGVEGGDREDLFRLFSGVLYRRGMAERGERAWRLAVPGNLRRDVARACHVDPSGGHEGQRKTFWRARQRYWWPKMELDIRRLVRCCPSCQVRKTPTCRPVGMLEPIAPPDGPFRFWGVDHMGPLPRSPRGNRYIIVAIDYFSKQVVAAALPSARSGPALRFLRDEIVYKYGVPDKIQSDQGRAFVSREWVEAMDKMGIRHVLSSPEHPQANGLVERANGVIINRMFAYVQDKMEDWDEWVQSAAFAINTAVQESTKMAPFEILYGQPARLPLDALFPWPNEGIAQEIRMQRVLRARGEVSDRIFAAQQQQKQQYDRRRQPAMDFQPGDLVLVRRRRTKKGIPRKFQPNFIGPFEIRRRLGHGSVEVGDLACNRTPGRHRIFTAAAGQLKRFYPPETLEEEEGDPGADVDGDWEDVSSEESEGEEPVLDRDVPVPETPDGRPDDAAALDQNGEQPQPPAGTETPEGRPRRARRLPAALRDYVVY